ncbi:hypothetical protein KKC88_00265 [Patescibacteria group bacterium]|nr:hypothetical protein [Patescibacteria group bacterium]MBU1673430.1 hypothetical protein [Patescibacteria group bacterium]MBU1963369.1 hypothetical protein [Patescibacteria group bacterium]
MNYPIESTILLITFLINFSIAFLVFIKNPKKKVNIIFSLLTFFIALWNLLNLLSFIFQEHDKVYIFTQWALGAVLFIPALLLYFTIIFPKEIKISKWIIAAIFIPGFIFLPFIPTKYNLIGFTGEPYGTNFIPGPLYFYYSIYFILFVAIALGILIWKYKKEKGIARMQIRYIFLGSIITAIVGITTNAILPLIWSAQLNVYGTPASIIFGICAAYAILKYRLMDIRLVIKKSIFYFLSLSVLVLIAIIFAVFVQKLFEQYLRIDPIITVAILMVILILILPKIRDYIREKFDDMFHKDYIDFSERIEKIEKAPRAGNQLFDLAKEVSGSIKTITKADSVKFYYSNRRIKKYEQAFPDEPGHYFNQTSLIQDLIENRLFLVKEELNIKKVEDIEKKNYFKTLKKEMSKIKGEIIVPLMSGPELVGIIVIGNKRNNESYTKEDIEFVNEIMDNIGDLLANIILFKEAVERAQIQQNQ